MNSCSKCGCFIYRPEQGDASYNPKSGLCRACFLNELIKQAEAATGLLYKRRTWGKG